MIAALLIAAALQIPAQEIVADIRVHGNVATSDDEIRRLAGIEVGAALDPNTVADITAKLRATKRFERVAVLKRYASIADPTQVLLVIIVDEGVVDVQKTGDADHPIRVRKPRGPNLMFLPLLTYEDGYGFIYGAQIATPDPVGAYSRLSFPLTWGGEKRAAAELEKSLDERSNTRLSGGVSIDRRTHPFYQQDEDRGRVWVRGERQIVKDLRAGATAGWQHVSFLGSTDTFATAGADIVFDNRLDPMLARNAVYGRAAIDHFSLDAGRSVSTSHLEGRGYLGLLGQSVLVVRAIREDASAPLPPYLQPILGGYANLRGFEAGTAVGDTLVAGTLELRLPLTSPLEIGKIGVSAFVDAGTAYRKDQRLSDQPFKQGVGGSLWFSAAVVRLNIAVAHGIGGSTHVHFGGSLSF